MQPHEKATCTTTQNQMKKTLASSTLKANKLAPVQLYKLLNINYNVKTIP